MKRFFILTSIVAILCSACSNNDDESSSGTKTKASLKVTLVGKGVTPRSVGAPTQAEENAIHGFTVYVFANNILEKAATSTTLEGLELFIDNLTTGVKRVVVVANAPALFPTFEEGDPYSKFALAASYIHLDDQDGSLTNGLVMSGEEVITLQSESAGTNDLDISISRIVAKIKLGTITIDPAVGSNPALFELTGVAIIKSKSLSSIGIPSIVTTQPFYSGIEGLTVQGANVKEYLYEAIELDDHDERYFYVFANTDGGSDDADATLLTLEGTYNGEVMYFPFRLPAIVRNTQHTLDITLRRLGTGSPDPEVPSDPATLTVTITPEDWVVVPNQSAEW
ncbi:major fimbrial subunit protein FimA [Dysgonomonas alginatilytica]|uniref:Major fimbrial subunit protein FimA n=1 Tax=Dysgonomonas alginatilytica TaxID=1605892 RepID=A0A2V3PPH2_9BACT|nr:fimbrial protein [Dysgonomonas alginatilytica]PXV58386.1 major fimbrial subunit protein FimA [Dysgonomonas alginatilytica]